MCKQQEQQAADYIIAIDGDEKFIYTDFKKFQNEVIKKIPWIRFRTGVSLDKVDETLLDLQNLSNCEEYRKQNKKHKERIFKCVFKNKCYNAATKWTPLTNAPVDYYTGQQCDKFQQQHTSK